MYAHLMQKLNIYDAKHKDELVEYEIPEFIFEMLLFGYAQLAEHHALYRFAQQNQTTVCHVDDRLYGRTIREEERERKGDNNNKKKTTTMNTK